MSTAATDLRHTGEWVLSGTVPLIVESIVWAFSLASLTLVLSFHVHRAAGSSLRRPRIMLLAALVLMFLLTTFFYILDIFWFFYQVRGVLLQALDNDGKVTPTEKQQQLIQQQRLLMQIGPHTAWLSAAFIGDSIMIWRAWELSSRNPWFVAFPIVCLLGYLATIPPSIKCLLEHPVGVPLYAPSSPCRSLALGSWAASLAVNLSATCVIAYIGWSHFSVMRQVLGCRKKTSTPEKILMLLAESGFLYFLSNLMTLLISSIPVDQYDSGRVLAATFSAIMPHQVTLMAVLTFALVLTYTSLWDAMREDGLATSIQFSTSVLHSGPVASTDTASTYNRHANCSKASQSETEK